MTGTLPALEVYERNKTFTISNPSSMQLKEYLYRLDGIQVLHLVIVMPAGRVFILSSVEGRMYVYFAGDTSDIKFGWLLDKSESSEEEIEFLLHNGQVDAHPLNETVTREKSFEAARYFLEFNTLPKELDWFVDV